MYVMSYTFLLDKVNGMQIRFEMDHHWRNDKALAGHKTIIECKQLLIK